MATVTFKVNTASTTNASSYASGSFTPVASDLLVVFVHASGTVTDAQMLSSTGILFTQVAAFLDATSVNRVYCYVAGSLATAVAQTVTWSYTGTAASGAVIQVYAVAGMTRLGTFAVRQSAGQSNQAALGTPAPTFGVAVLTGNPALGAIGNSTNPATLTPPTSWTEGADSGYATPTTGLESVFISSGFTGTTVTWGSTSTTAFGSLIVELDTSTNTSPTVALNAPADLGTVVTTTPQVTFTGTDAQSNPIQYEIQIDTVNTFNSTGGQPLIDKVS